MHVCVDDATRLAYAEVLEGGEGNDGGRLPARAVAHSNAHGIRVERVMTDNGSAYLGIAHALACRR